jgi:L-fucose mutarotase
MIRGKLIHPEILAALAGAGHGSKVLITDGNFPHATAPSIEAPRVYLNLSPGVLTVSQVLDVLLEAIPIERAALMDPQDPADPTPPAHADLLGRLPAGIEIDHILRMDFYPATDTPDLALVIATGDMRFYANVLLTIGVVGTGE